METPTSCYICPAETKQVIATEKVYQVPSLFASAFAQCVSWDIDLSGLKNLVLHHKELISCLIIPCGCGNRCFYCSNYWNTSDPIFYRKEKSNIVVAYVDHIYEVVPKKSVAN